MNFLSADAIRRRGVTVMELPCIAEVNADKFGCFTPGTLIPIVPEDEARRSRWAPPEP